MGNLQNSTSHWLGLQARFTGALLIGFLGSLSCNQGQEEKIPEDVSVFEPGWNTFLTSGNFHTWQRTGEAKFEFSDGVLIGSAKDMARNSFLVSPSTYGDFELEVEVKILPGGNSGIQIRSHLDKEKDRVFGYQIEIDTSERAWSGGLYDEGRRGWLNSLKDMPQARASFKNGEWNRYRIRCQGDHIQSWVNGVPCADFHDDVDASGYIAFQVHGGKSAEVRWRNLWIQEL